MLRVCHECREQTSQSTEHLAWLFSRVPTGGVAPCPHERGGPVEAPHGAPGSGSAWKNTAVHWALGCARAMPGEPRGSR